MERATFPGIACKMDDYLRYIMDDETLIALLQIRRHNIQVSPANSDGS